jgi:hypothetical protein
MEYKYGKNDNKERDNIIYLTNRKKILGIWDKFLETFCCCFSHDLFDDEDDIPSTDPKVI